MKKFFIIANGSNDLYYPISGRINELLGQLSIFKDVEINILYKLQKFGLNKLWKNEGESEFDKAPIMELSYINGIIYNKNPVNYFKIIDVFGKIGNVIDFEKYLTEKLNDEDDNIIIISGHGGPFQSLLDLSEVEGISLNTRMFCNILNSFKIKLLFLDMCAMNYLEVAYEILNKGNVSGIITYKGLAPFKGESYVNLIKEILSNKNEIEYIKESQLPLIYLNAESLPYLEMVKRCLDEIARKSITTKAIFDNEIIEIKMYLENGVIQNEKSREIKSLPLAFIKYYLEDKEERIIYNKYKIAERNLYRFLVSKEEIEVEPSYLILERESLEHILWLHNPMLTRVEIEEKINLLKDKYKQL